MITQVELSKAETELNRAIEAAGLAVRFEVINGSRVMGTAYRLESRNTEEFARTIGNTRAEAVATLTGMALAFRVVERDNLQKEAGNG